MSVHEHYQVLNSKFQIKKEIQVNMTVHAVVIQDSMTWWLGNWTWNPGNPEFRSHSDHQLDLFQVVSGWYPLPVGILILLKSFEFLDCPEDV